MRLVPSVDEGVRDVVWSWWLTVENYKIWSSYLWHGVVS
jgi:hypothetical protein